MKKIILSTAVALFLLSGQKAWAVPVGTTPDTRPAAPQQRKQWTNQGLNIQLGGSFLQGNVNLLNVNSSLSYNYNIGQHQFFADAGNIFTQAGTQIIANRINSSLLYAYNVLDNLNVYYYMAHAHDTSTKLDYRFTNGLGVCLHKIARPVFDVFLVSLGVSTENEWFQENISSLTLRSVLRLSATLPITDVLSIGVDSFYSPSLNNFSDFRMYGEGFLNIKLSGDFLNLKLSVADEYNSVTQKSVKNNDFGVFATLGLNVGN